MVQLAGRAGEVHAAEAETVNTDTGPCECLYGIPHIHRVAPEAVQLRDHQDIPRFELVEELPESGALRGRYGTPRQFP